MPDMASSLSTSPPYKQRQKPLSNSLPTTLVRSLSQPLFSQDLVRSLPQPLLPQHLARSVRQNVLPHNVVSSLRSKWCVATVVISQILINISSILVIISHILLFHNFYLSYQNSKKTAQKRRQMWLQTPTATKRMTPTKTTEPKVRGSLPLPKSLQRPTLQLRFQLGTSTATLAIIVGCYCHVPRCLFNSWLCVSTFHLHRFSPQGRRGEEERW